MSSLIVKRNELKYYINYNDYLLLSKILKDHFIPDERAINNNGYIRSLYFDTIFDGAFFEKEAGVLNRKKYRLRTYNLDADKVKFEIKNKYNDVILKESAFVSRKDAIEIQKGNYSVLLNYDDEILLKIYSEFMNKQYRPVVLIDYNRESYNFPMNNIRITFDKGLKCSSEELDLFKDDVLMKPLLKKGILVLEIKYDNFLPLFVKELIRIPRFERSAVSKYTIGRMGEYV